MTGTTRRWPVDPLLDLPRRSARDVYRALNVSGTKWKRLCEDGLTDWEADRAAIRLDTFPHLVWGPAWIDTGLGPLDDDYLNGGWRQIWEWNEAA